MDLRGKTVLITRAASQSEELREGLSRLGARVIECPTIQIAPVDDWSLVDHAISRLGSYQWLLFTSANAVDCFMKRVEAVGASANQMQIAAVGSATASKLADYRLTASLTPENYRAEGLLEAFPSDLRGVRFLFPRAETARELLPEDMRRRGATVDVVTVYRTVRAEGLPDIKEVLAGEHIDCVVFTSPSTIRFMAETFEGDLAVALKGVSVAVIGPVTLQAAESFGLRVKIQPKRSTTVDLLNAIAREL